MSKYVSDDFRRQALETLAEMSPEAKRQFANRFNNEVIIPAQNDVIDIYRAALIKIARLSELDTTDMSLLTVAKEMQSIARGALDEGE